MSKKLKKRIRELCGLDTLSREQRLKLCQSLLSDNQFKQQACNKVPGLTFKDIDKVLNDELADRKPTTEAEEIYKELEEEYPDKIEFTSGGKYPGAAKNSHTGNYSLEEVQELMRATDRVIKEPSSMKFNTYHVYSLSEVAALMACDYDPRRHEKRYRSDK